MKIAILTMGTRGDVAPFLVLSHRLQQAGFEMTLGADPQFASEIRRQDVAFHRCDFRCDSS